MDLDLLDVGVKALLLVGHVGLACVRLELDGIVINGLNGLGIDGLGIDGLELMDLN